MFSRALPILLIIGTGCHGRFQRHIGAVNAIQIVHETRVGPDVSLARMQTVSPMFDGVAADAYNLSQSLREQRLAAIIAEAVDPSAMNAAFGYGLRQSLQDGRPFEAVDQADAVMDLHVVDWGLRVSGPPFPAVFTYKVRVRAFRADGRPFYRATFRCAGDAGQARWIDASGFRTVRDEAMLRGLPAGAIQETFDKAAFGCGQQFADKIRADAG